MLSARKTPVRLHHLGGLVRFGNVMVSPALMRRLADEGKSLVLLNDAGRFKARLEGPISGNILLRQAQHRQAGDPAFTLEFARAVVAGKLKNSRGAREAVDDTEATQLARTADNLAASLRAAAAVNLIVKPAMREHFQLNGRTRRPPLDRFNALISFLYAMLMNDCRSALETAGLDPQLGFLHAVRPGRAALALDLQKEFRAILCDRLALTLINCGQVGGKDFDLREGGAVMLNDKGRRAVVTAWQERKQEEITPPLTENILPFALPPFVSQALPGTAFAPPSTCLLMAHCWAMERMLLTTQ
jgi:CRISPR-associated protein Cas1